MARWAPRDGLGLGGQRGRHGDSARLPPEGPIEVVTAAAAEAGRPQGEVAELVGQTIHDDVGLAEVEVLPRLRHAVRIPALLQVAQQTRRPSAPAPTPRWGSWRRTC